MVGTSPAMTTVFWTTIVRQKHQRDHATRLSHRELCGGEILSGIVCVMLQMFLATSPAVAEVCDKVVGDHWRPSDGQSGQSSPGAGPRFHPSCSCSCSAF